MLMNVANQVTPASIGVSTLSVLTCAAVMLVITLSDDGRTCYVMECGKPDGIPGIVVKCDGSAEQYRLDINSRETLDDSLFHAGQYSFWTDWQ